MDQAAIPRFMMRPAAGRGASLRAWLALLTLAAMLPLLLVLVAEAWSRYQEDHEQAGQHTLEVARGLAATVQRELDTLTTGLQVLADTQSLLAGDFVAFRARADEYLRMLPPGSAVLLFDTAGRQQLALGPSPLAAGPATDGGLEQVRRVVETGSPQISGVYRVPADARPVYSIAVPVFRDGTVVQVLALFPPPDVFRQIIADQRLAPDYVVSVVDREGVHIARSPAGMRFVGQPVGPTLRQQLGVRDEGLLETTTLEGVAVLAAFSRVQPSGWAVAIGVPLAVVGAPMREALWLALGASAAALGAGLLLAGVVAGKVLGPMRSLGRIAAGKTALLSPRPLGLREAEAVASALRLSALDRQASDAEREELLGQLARERARLAAVFDAAPVGLVFAEGPQGRIFGANPQTAAITRHPVHYSSGVGSYADWASWHADGRRVAPEEYPLARALAGEERPELEVHYQRGDGSKAWVRLIAAPIRDARGGVVGGVVALLDIDRERRAAEALEASQAQLRDLLEGMDEGFVTMDRDFTLLSLNAAGERMASLPRADILGRTHWDVWPATRGTALQDAYARVIEEGVSAAMEFRYHADAKDIWLDVRAYPTGGGMAVFYRDISDRKSAEAAARRSAELFRAIGEATPDLIFVKDNESRMTYANPAMLATLGRPWDEVVGRSDTEWAIPEEAAAMLETDRRVMQGGVAEVLEEVFTGPLGRRVFLSTKAPMRDAGGAVVGMVGVATDITSRNRAEEQRTLLIHELNHRVKNTLATVQSIAQQALRGPAVDPALREAFEARLLALSAAHDVLTRESWEGANLHDVAEAALRPHAQPGRFVVRGPRLRLEPKTALALGMALHELCTNAAKYGALTMPGGRVELSWDVHGPTDAPRLGLTWREQGGPPVDPPSRRGFGSRLVERALAQELRGAVAIRFDPAGVVCTIDAPLPDERAMRPEQPV